MAFKKKNQPVEETTPEQDAAEQAALLILADIKNSDSRWADLSGRDSAVVEYAVSRGWLETNDRVKDTGRYMLTKKGVRALERDED